MQSANVLDWKSPDHIGSLIDLLIENAKKHPERLFCKDHNYSATYAEALETVQGFARIHEPKIKGKDVVISMNNSSNFLITYLGVLFSGGVPALLNANLPLKTGKNLVESLEPAEVFADQALPFTAGNQVVVDAKMLGDWKAKSGPIDSACGQGDDPAMYLFTGGTTGIPKRVLYTHRKIIVAGERMCWGWPMRDAEVFLPIAPFSHVYGFLMGVCVPLLSAGSSVMIERFRPADAIDAIEKYHVTVLGGGPPAIYQALMSVPDLAERDISHLRVCPGGGAPFPLAVHDNWEKMTGKRIYEGYGMTEIAPIAVNTEKSGYRAGTSGKPVPDTEIKIVSLDGSRTTLTKGNPGEICVRGPHLMDGYFKNPEETKTALIDGWVFTGDIGFIDDDGFLTITDRKKDVILHNGFNVFPREVEEALLKHPQVIAACVIGIPDARSGEVVAAFICCRDGQDVSDEELVDHCRDYLLSYRLPTRIERLEKMPLTPAGKLDRMALRRVAQTA